MRIGASPAVCAHSPAGKRRAASRLVKAGGESKNGAAKSLRRKGLARRHLVDTAPDLERCRNGSSARRDASPLPSWQRQEHWTRIRHHAHATRLDRPPARARGPLRALPARRSERGAREPHGRDHDAPARGLRDHRSARDGCVDRALREPLARARGRRGRRGPAARARRALDRKSAQGRRRDARHRRRARRARARDTREHPKHPFRRADPHGMERAARSAEGRRPALPAQDGRERQGLARAHRGRGRVVQRRRPRVPRRAGRVAARALGRSGRAVRRERAGNETGRERGHGAGGGRSRRLDAARREARADRCARADAAALGRRDDAAPAERAVARRRRRRAARVPLRSRAHEGRGRASVRRRSGDELAASASREPSTGSAAR